MTSLSPLRLSLDDKLDALRKLNPTGNWQSLDDQRFCTRCEHIITGRQIEVAGGTRAHGPLRLECPTAGCPGTPETWTKLARHGGKRHRTGAGDVDSAPSRVEIRGQAENISITHNGRAAVILRSSAPARRRRNWLAQNILSIVTDCRSLLSLLRRSPGPNFYPVS